MKLTTGILLCTMATGMAVAQNPSVINNTRNTTKAVQTVAQKNSAPAAKAAVVPTSKPTPAVKPATHVAVAAAAQKVEAKKPSAVAAPKAAAPKTNAKAAEKHPAAPVKSAAKKPAKAVERVAVETKKSPVETAKKEGPKTINLAGRRDPFISPVVNRSMTGSGCSTGKRCLAVDQIALKGVVKSDNGMIAVVVNAVNKAYFLRENDPVFNGYVVKITGDSIIFKETMQDKLGKSFTREVTKKITTPAV